ncbi:MAG TPA: hypothetical protein VKG44_05190 [Candidatus Baltobacteraceae bacterium]|nr:hypothetical protein [Candidatus Baltobacteraceae bacterium]
MLGNRGVLVDDERRIVRAWQVRRWIACRLEFRGLRRELMRPRRWTELFFLDEAAAFAAGHRPCAACRYPNYKHFRTLWLACHGGAGKADDIDARLHADRLLDRATKRTYRRRLADLPDGAYVVIEGTCGLVWGERFFAWSDAGYVSWRPRPANALVDVLTPRAVVAVLEAGYLPEIHPSAATAKRSA